jgi:hypothetical protein
MGKGGDGFTARIDPVGGDLFQGSNSGSMARCINTNPAPPALPNVCTAPGASWSSISSNAMLGDQQSFVLPYEIFKGTPGNPGGRPDTDCSATNCNHIVAGTVRVWETINSHTVSRNSGWYVNSPANLTKQSLGNRSYINQLAYSPATYTLAMVGTNDGNVQIGRNMGTGSNQSIWTDVTGGNAVLPNRPINDVQFDPRSMDTTDAPAIGYAAVGGFNPNTPSTPGHVFQVTCTVNCASFTWLDKTGNLPDIPVDSIIANPKFPQQVFAGTDFGLYVTDDITQATPTWYRLQNGLPNVMVWDLQIDRGATTLSIWTRSRGAYVWPLPTKRLVKLDQTISFAQPADAVWQDADFDVSASASSGLAVSFAANGNCTVSGATVHITGAGSCTITASQGGDSDTWNAAPAVAVTFAIAKADQSIDVGTATPHRFGDADFELDASATSKLPVSLAVSSGNCTLSAATSPANVHIAGAGECDIVASQSGDANFNAAANVTRTFQIDKADQTITFNALGDKTYGDADFSLAAAATSRNDVTFSVTGDCTVASGSVHITGAGSCTVTASQGGDGNYNPAPDVSQSFAIAKAAQSISFDSPGNKTYGDPDFTLGATSSSHLGVTYAAAGTCTVSGAVVHITGAGSCTITASQAGDGNYNPAADVAQPFTIAQAQQTITFASIANATFGDADFSISPTASSGLTVYLIVSSGPCVVDQSTSPAHVHLTGAGTCTITATQPGDANHAAAPAVSRSFTIAKGSQTITFAPLPNRTFGGPITLGATASSGLAIAYSVGSGSSCTVSGATLTITGVGSCAVTAAQSGNANYNAAASVTRTFQVTSSQSGTADGKDLHPSTGGSADFQVDANGPGPKGLSGELSYNAPRIKGSPDPRPFNSEQITAFGIAADGNSAWIAGVAKDGRAFRAYVEDNSRAKPKPKQSTADADVFQLWIGGVLQTDDGSLSSGDVRIDTSRDH